MPERSRQAFRADETGQLEPCLADSMDVEATDFDPCRGRLRSGAIFGDEGEADVEALTIEGAAPAPRRRVRLRRRQGGE